MRSLLLLLAFSASAWAQAGKSELFGTVLDPAKLPIQGASLTAEEPSTGAKFVVQSGAAGAYHFLGLPPGEYRVTVTHDGFRELKRSGILLRLAEQTAIDFTLEVGQKTESVDVSAAAPLLETASGTVGFHATKATIEALPLDGRNFIPLVTLAPGVALPGGGSLLPRINGSRPRTNEYIYDGISVLQPEPGQVVYYPIVDAMEEFKLSINAYSPEYGRSNGGSILVSGKSGSNEFHGTMFEFFRNEALNARNFFAQPGPNPEFRRNQYGLVLGGPVRKNKTFFFLDWQGTRLRTGITRFSTVPSLAQRTTQVAAPDPAAQAILARYPLPNRAGTANNYVRTGVEPDKQDQADGRIDHVFNSKHRVFGRYGYLRDDDTPVTPLPDGSGVISSGVTGHAITRGDSVASEYDWTISPSTLNQARFGYTRRTLIQNELADNPAIYTLTGFAQIGPTSAANTNFKTDVTEYLDTFSTVRGRHTIKAGFDIRREALDVFNPANPAGSYAFTSIAGLLQGQVNSFSIDIQQGALHERAHIAEFFCR